MKAEEVDLAKFNEGMALLYGSGLFAFLEGRARPGWIADCPESNYSERHVAELHRSVGYFQALDDILKFKELYRRTEIVREAPAMDFGAVQHLVDSGRITKEEGDELTKHFAARTIAG